MSKILPNPYFSAILISAITSFVLTYLVREAARRWQLMDVPGAHKQHGVATPTLGGIAMFIAFAVTILTHSFVSTHVPAILFAGMMMVIVGLCDELRGVSANIKLGALGIATMILVHGGVEIKLGLHGLAALVVTFLWVGLVSSAFNGIDNADVPVVEIEEATERQASSKKCVRM